MSETDVAKAVAELKERIIAKGLELKQLTEAKAGIKAPAKELQALKAQYKELTGEEYKSKTDENKAAAQSAGDKKREGPSKKDLKREAKKAHVKDKKAEGDSVVASTQTSSSAITNSFYTGSDVVLYGSPGSTDLLKCLVAAELYQVPILTTGEDPAEFLKLQGVPAVTALAAEGGVIVIGANAICRFLSKKGQVPSSTNGGVVELDLIMEWEERLLGPALSVENYSGCLAAVEEKLSKLPSDSCFICGGASPTLADVVVGPTVKRAAAKADIAGYPIVQAYLSSLSELAAFVEAEKRSVAYEREMSGTSGLQRALVKLFTAAIYKAFPGLASSEVAAGAANKEQQNDLLGQVDIQRGQAKYGDFQCNSAMLIHALLKAGKVPGSSVSKSPMEVAEKIMGALPRSQLLASASVTKPGFVNVRLHPQYLKRNVVHLIKHGVTPPTSRPLRVTVDFSSPNIAKEMHVGHLRSTILGESICRILEFCGHEVMRVNHVGDWGTQFGMLINYLKVAYPDFMTSPPDITDLTTFYKGAKKAFDDSEDFKNMSRETVVALQSGDEECLKVWDVLCDISRQAFQKVYKRLDVTLEEKGESFYNSRIPGVISELQSQGVTKMDNGAVITILDTFTFPLILRKSDGGYGYDSTDMAALSYRLREQRSDWLVYVTDEGQAGHFDMIFALARAVGWAKDDTHRLLHVPFGVVKGEDGQKFKSRSGDSVRLVDLLDEAVQRMEEILMERVKGGKSPITPEEVKNAAEAIGYGAVKYFDMRQSPRSPYVFSYDRMLDTRGNTAVYLLFAHARLASIIRKAEAEKGVDMSALKAVAEATELEHESERALALELACFPDIIEKFLETMGPNTICEYLYEVSIRFTDFVTNCQVLGTPEQNSRLLLCEACGVMMRKCFELLGIRVLHKI